jgi:hypothetical protein
MMIGEGLEEIRLACSLWEAWQVDEAGVGELHYMAIR